MTGSGGSKAFRSEVSGSRLVTALVAGFVATHIATVTGYWFHGSNLPDLGWPNFNGILLLGVDASPVSQFVAGSVYHAATGICFALFYAFVAYPWLPFKQTRGGNILKAELFAVVLATLSAAWWVPQTLQSGLQLRLRLVQPEPRHLLANGRLEADRWNLPLAPDLRLEPRVDLQSAVGRRLSPEENRLDRVGQRRRSPCPPGHHDQVWLMPS